MNKKLTKLLEKKRKQGGTAEPIDWDERRNKYLEAVNDLYQQIEAEFAEPIAQKTVMMYRRSKNLTESYIGTYSVDDLILLIGDEQVRFSPQGRNIAGAMGRIDMLGERAEVPLILLPDSKWAFIETRQPTLRTAPFDDSTLAEALQVVMRA